MHEQKTSQRDVKSIELRDRRNHYDVTDTVDVSSAPDVRRAVRELFVATFPGAAFDRLWLAFHDFERIYSGRFPGYLGCDTTYHDLQHTLDMTLAMARLIAGHERTVPADERLGVARAELGLIISLFHDAGYIRHEERDREYRNGAEFTRWHVRRSAEFLIDYLPGIGLGDVAANAGEIVHFTGYERALEDIALNDPRDVRCGHLLGTADLIAQMADRCYLEKCRDRLYSEFVIGGVAMPLGEDGKPDVQIDSGEELLRQTPRFFQDSAKKRLQESFGKAYRFMEQVFGGRNPYIEAINNNLRHLQHVIRNEDWDALRRNPEAFVGTEDASDSMRIMVAELRSLIDSEQSPEVA